MRKFAASLLACLVLCGCAAARAAGVENWQAQAQGERVAFSFDAPEHAFLTLQVKTVAESFTAVLAGENGHFAGAFDLRLTYPGMKVNVEVRSAKNTRLAAYDVKFAEFTPAPAPARVPGGRLEGVTVCIDPGHQQTMVVKTEPVGPGLKGTKKTSVGMAQGALTRRMESVVALEIGLKLRDALLLEGAQVVLTREAQDVKVGNVERAQIANDAGASYFLRLHCNMGSKTAQGLRVYCPKNSDYAQAIATQETYAQWAQIMLEEMMAATGHRKGGTQLTNRYVGSNWAKMPVFLIEMGYMSNPQEDLLLSTPAYQQALVNGMVNGILALEEARR